jgi:hypothetical protein
MIPPPQESFGRLPELDRDAALFGHGRAITHNTADALRARHFCNGKRTRSPR